MGFSFLHEAAVKWPESTHDLIPVTDASQDDRLLGDIFSLSDGLANYLTLSHPHPFPPSLTPRPPCTHIRAPTPLHTRISLHAHKNAGAAFVGATGPVSCGKSGIRGSTDRAAALDKQSVESEMLAAQHIAGTRHKSPWTKLTQ